MNKVVVFRPTAERNTIFGKLSRWPESKRTLQMSLRTEATLRRGLAALGPEVVGGLRFVCGDMWKPYLKVVAAKVGQALHVLDRFHITMHLNRAVDEVRRRESGRLRGRPLAQRLKKMRWKLLRRGNRVRGQAKQRLWGLLHAKLATGRAWMLKETFQDFWRYRSVTWAGAFLDVWCERALRSRIEPMRKVARMLRKHEGLILNWFRAKGEISTGVVEGLNNKIRVVTRRSYGFRKNITWIWWCVLRLRCAAVSSTTIWLPDSGSPVWGNWSSPVSARIVS